MYTMICENRGPVMPSQQAVDTLDVLGICSWKFIFWRNLHSLGDVVNITSVAFKFPITLLMLYYLGWFELGACISELMQKDTHELVNVAWMDG